jgi:RND family efflux transporter MFP subunit
MQKMPVARKYTLFLAAGIALLVVLLWVTRPEPQLQQVELPPLKVTVTQVEQRDVQPQVRVGGYLQPLQQARLQFQVAGRLQERLVEPGQQVAAGAKLLRLDADDYRDLMAEAKAQLQQEQAAARRDKALLDLAERNSALQGEEVKRQQRLGSDSLSSKAALDAARQKLIQVQGDVERLRYSVNTADARLAALQAAARRAERNWRRTTLTAPFAGMVNRVVPEIGDDVAAKDVVVELLDLSQLEFYCEIDLAAAAQLHLGQTIHVSSQGKTLDASVVALQQDPDPQTYTYALRARFDNPGLLSGAPAEAELLLPPLKQALVVPLSAVVHDDGHTYLYAVVDGVLQRRAVELGPRLEEAQVILDGVAAGETIVSRGGAALSNGLRVSI